MQKVAQKRAGARGKFDHVKVDVRESRSGGWTSEYYKLGSCRDSVTVYGRTGLIEHLFLFFYDIARLVLFV